MSDSWQAQALDRLEKELKDGKAVDRHSGVMAEPVSEALKEFCRQEDEFAQAMVQGGKFADCMKAVSKGVSSALSDLEAYRRAARQAGGCPAGADGRTGTGYSGEAGGGRARERRLQ